jgi:NAD(P)H dehydrogenase (quinone)
MDALVVVAHPCGESLTHAAAAAAVRGLERAGNAVEVLDLYALGFRAAMSPEERAAYHGDTPILDPMVAHHAEMVRTATCLTFVYPTWWSTMPAILKGWFERVMAPGVAFVFDAETHEVRPGLRQVRHLVGISTYGSPRSYVAAVNDNGRRTINRSLRVSTGFRTRTHWLGLYAVDSSTPEDRSRFLDRVERTTGKLRP